MEENTLKVSFKLISEKAKCPTKGSKGAACYDLYSAQNINIPVGHRIAIDTGICMNFPSKIHGEIKSRSGIALNNYVDVVAGMIDSDYTGPITVVLHNSHPSNSFKINVGDRIAQIKFFSGIDICLVESNKNENWEMESCRGNKGFGSSGK